MYFWFFPAKASLNYCYNMQFPDIVLPELFWLVEIKSCDI